MASDVPVEPVQHRSRMFFLCHDALQACLHAKYCGLTVQLISDYAQVIPFDIPMVLTTTRIGHSQLRKPAYAAGEQVSVIAAQQQR